MKIFIKGLCLIFLFQVLPASIYGQEKKEKNWTLRGYVKDLVTFNFLQENNLFNESLFVDNLIHNRLNFKWYVTEDFSLNLEVRNRLFHGDLVKAIPNYSRFIDVNDDYLDLSVNVIDRKDVVLHSMIDRAFVQWNKNDWEIRFGRQRINWGTNLVWNPNDLFNAYSFFDFDYEERPGSDALRIQRYIGVASSFEVAVKMADDTEDLVAAGMWKINKGGYDVQFLGGYANEDIALGLGWAGNIKTSGFKGEMTYFHPTESSDSKTYLLALTWDYSFKNSLYVLWSGIYNSSGSNEPSQFETVSFTSNQRLTAKDLSPYRYSSIVQGSYPIHPLVNAGLAIMVFPGDRSMFIYPTVSWSIIQNLDIDLFGQFFWDDPNGTFESTSKLIFVRGKWSF